MCTVLKPLSCTILSLNIWLSFLVLFSITFPNQRRAMSRASVVLCLCYGMLGPHYEPTYRCHGKPTPHTLPSYRSEYLTVLSPTNSTQCQICPSRVATVTVGDPDRPGCMCLRRERIAKGVQGGLPQWLFNLVDTGGPHCKSQCAVWAGQFHPHGNDGRLVFLCIRGR